MSRQELDILLQKFMTDQASAADRQQLRIYVHNEQYQSYIKDWIEQQLLSGKESFSDFDQGMVFDKIIQSESPVLPVHRVHFLKTAWFRYAAAIIIVFGIGAYLWNANKKESTALVQNTSSVPLNKDIAPGGNRAILVLADGKKILLDSVQGSIAEQGNLQVINDHGKLEYEGKSNRVDYHLLSTPRGGQYHLQLPDGSKVWLNAASSIRYPTSFTGSERKVEVTGEVYFEVAKNATMPFRVTLDRETEIQVLGTHFNVNAYADELSIRTTLLEGKVKVSKEKGSVLLQPGQQAIVKENIQVKKGVDASRAIAWKNGVFNFEDAPFDEFMRQLARWYDLQIVYKGKVPQKILRGDLGRNLPLSEILEVLSLFDVQYSLDGKVLTIQ